MMQFEPGTIKAVAVALLGEPNHRLSSEAKLCFGNHGSLAVNIAENCWYDHEQNLGGGLLDLVGREAALPDRAEQIQWLRDNDLVDVEQRPGKRIVAAYDYRDESGALAFQVVRHEPKDFRQRRPDGNGGWDWKVKGARQVPYRLPDLIGQPHATVYVVEGEKDADRLASLGLVATCNAGGAGKWRDVHSEHLKGRSVVVLGDNDDAGRSHAKQVAKSLRGVAAEVRVVELPDLPEKGDVSDWIQAGGTIAELRQLTTSVTPLAAAMEDEDPPDLHRNAPRPDPACLHGLIGKIARTAAETTEANPYAVAANLIAYLCAAVGRRVYMPIGNTWHHPRVSINHVGRSAIARKGDAQNVIHRIDKAIRERCEHIAPQVHRGGLSSREGLAFLMHDGYTDGKNDVEPIHDKRLWVVESEFANVLGQSKREGNTLSTALRDCFDGVSIRPATKSNRMWATDPHMTMSAAITPSEFRGSISTRELTNGSANRYVVIWAERTRVLPFPQPTPQDTINDFADKIIAILRDIGADRYAEKDVHRAELSPDAQKVYAKLYLGELNDRSAGEHITALLERRAPILLRLAMLFAIFDQSARVVDVEHVNAALAWIRYWTDSIKFVFASAVDEVAAAETSATAEKIVKFLGSKGQATRKAITVECFSGHLSKDKIDVALEELLTNTPPLIEVETVQTAGRAAKVYRLMVANKANVANDEHPRGLRGDFQVREPRELSEPRSFGGKTDQAIVRQVSQVREPPNAPETRMDASCSPSSPSSHNTLEVEAQGSQDSQHSSVLNGEPWEPCTESSAFEPGAPAGAEVL